LVLRLLAVAAVAVVCVGRQCDQSAIERNCLQLNAEAKTEATEIAIRSVRRFAAETDALDEVVLLFGRTLCDL
jgi:hypothetical protein